MPEADKSVVEPEAWKIARVWETVAVLPNAVLVALNRQVIG